jgi:16S rRNA (adenine1518-N6/adenine1519-N6)-dimethyltransferase
MRPNKRLGQHFLCDPGVLREIVEVADPERSAGVLEIGPGEGVLTAFLARSRRPIVAIDADARAVEAVEIRLGDAVRVVHGDALEVDLASLLPPPVDSRLPVVVGNLPYNAGTAIYRRLLLLERRVSRHVLMFQKEVADRIVAGPGSKTYGILSVVTALCARAWKVCDVEPSAFRPPPKVRSAVILVEPLEAPLITAAEQAPLGAFVGRIFQTRRKTLLNVLGSQEVVDAHGLDGKARPETLSPETLLRLYRAGL